MAKLGSKVFASERLTFRLAAVAEQAINANDAIFVEIVGLTIRELRVLRIIDDNPGTTFVDISAATAMERSQTSRIIQKLIGDKLVRRKNSKTDARRFELYTTPAGQAARAKGREVSDGLEEILREPLSAKDAERLDAALERLAVWIHSEDYLRKLSAWRDGHRS